MQVNYLIFPGTSGAPWIDYLIVDKHVTPPDMSFSYPSTSLAAGAAAEQSVDSSMRPPKGEFSYSEKLVYLPHSYQVSGRHQHS